MEVWKEIAGYEGLYEVSNFGRMRSLDRIGNHAIYGDFVKKGQILTPCKTSGYPSYKLRLNKRTNTVYAHRIVLNTFVGQCPKGMEGCHNDGNKNNPRLDNLRWDTSKNNKLDMVAHGTDGKGERASMAKLTTIQVLEIRNSSERNGVLAKKYGVGTSTISLIIHRKNWTHLP
jgi:hypothetical protein